MVPLLLTINNFLHDFAAAMWVAAVVSILILRRQNNNQTREVSRILLRLVKTYANILFLSLASVFVTGILRATTYNYLTEQSTIHTYAVGAKHAVLLTLAGLSIVFARNTIKRWS
uniref:Copper resistance protein D domain-containing protein n=1 Tax=Ammonifex degensii TaxID=42838 RepID=A0A7C2IWP4_9THEO